MPYKLTTASRGNLKVAFDNELIASNPSPGTKWLVTGDFN
jgi:hypothetical protein